MNSILSNDASQIWTCKNRLLFLHSCTESLKIKWCITGINCEALYIYFESNNCRVIANSKSFSLALRKLRVTLLISALLSCNIPKNFYLAIFVIMLLVFLSYENAAICLIQIKFLYYYQGSEFSQFALCCLTLFLGNHYKNNCFLHCSY